MNSILCAGQYLDLSIPAVMGIVNATPDSFSDGGKFFSHGQVAVDVALKQAESMVLAGAKIIDVGGEYGKP